MTQRPRQDASDPRVLEPQRPPRVNLETRLLVVAERARVVEGARMDPEPVDRAGPGPIDRRLQQKRPELAADELRDQPEIGELSFVRGGRVQFEITGGYAAEIEDENLGRVLCDLRGERLVVEQPPLVP